MKKLLSLLTIFMLACTPFSCSKSEDPIAAKTTVQFNALLLGSNETIPNTSTATGSAILVFDTATKIFTVTITHTVPVLTMGHIHKAAAGTNGPVIFPFTSLTSPIVYTSAALDAAQEADLNAGLYYINLHSAAFPSGEIRGQLVKQY